MPLFVTALQHVRAMRGGAQSHLMYCSDGCHYVVKFQNNPQHTRVLFNDWLGTRLGQVIGLPVPSVAVVEVHRSVIEGSPDLRFEFRGARTMVPPGLSFGSRYVVSPSEGQLWDYLPQEMMRRVRNLRDFAGVLVLDKWTCNADGRQAVCWKLARQHKFTATFIDQGYCFNAGEWNFPDAPLRGVFGSNVVYECVTSWDSFEPWLTRIQNFPEDFLFSLAEEIPPDWYGGAVDERERVLSRLLARRAHVPELLLEFKNSSRNPFPNWCDRQVLPKIPPRTLPRPNWQPYTRLF
jgi:HipA-like kinase